MKIKLRLCEEDELDIKQDDVVNSEGEKVEDQKQPDEPIVEEKPDEQQVQSMVEPTPIIAPLEDQSQAEQAVEPAIPDTQPEVVAEPVVAPESAPIPAPINIEIVTPGAEPVAEISADPGCPECNETNCAAEIAQTSSSINTLIKGEWDSIELYNSVLPLFVDKKLDSAIETIKDIIAEEYVHVGQLEALLKSIDMNANSIAEGAAEQAGVPEVIPAPVAVGLEAAAHGIH